MDIAFIGGGNMATALISGLFRSGGGLSIRAADPSSDVRDRLTREFGIDTYAEGPQAVPGADVVVLAVKPQFIPPVLDQLSAVIEDGQLVLSVAAGTTVAELQSRLGHDTPVVRAMPNTPALIGKGVCGLFASASCKAHHNLQAERIMRAVGDTLWIEDESLMDVVTAVSGSGPAFFFALAEALARAGTELGLDEQDALRLAIHTAEGAGALMVVSSDAPATLRERVTSAGGTTEAALDVLQAKGFGDLVLDAVAAATRRGRELAG